eukprot:4938007-Pleurochrysis_carterae.AAC.1
MGIGQARDRLSSSRNMPRNEETMKMTRWNWPSHPLRRSKTSLDMLRRAHCVGPPRLNAGVRRRRTRRTIAAEKTAWSGVQSVPAVEATKAERESEPEDWAAQA